MIHMYLETPDSGQLLTLRSTDCWYLRCDCDAEDTARIYLNVLGNEYAICDSDTLTQGNPALDCYSVLAYYTAVIRAIYQHIQANGEEFIDISAIQENVLSDFWAEWKRCGYVHDEIPIRKEVYSNE